MGVSIRSGQLVVNIWKLTSTKFTGLIDVYAWTSIRGLNMVYRPLDQSQTWNGRLGEIWAIKMLMSAASILNGHFKQ